ncbi:MAG: PstS family phosphate ABC transporter substrate-binding protein [Planctomycetaceae bacterium]
MFNRLAERCCIGLVLGTAMLCGCSVERSSPATSMTHGNGNDGTPVEGSIVADGSSTVLPISMAVAETFEEAHPGVKVKVGRSGTGPGFDIFSRKESDISNASRKIKASEAEACDKAGFQFTELMIGIDGLTVVVNPKNDWCTALTVEQLVELWKKGSTVSKWSDLDPSWPAESITLFGPDNKSGTYDYFKEETVGKDNPMRTDYQPNSDDSVLVEGVSGDKHALGFFGFAYFIENQDKLKSVAIAPKGTSASAAVAPTVATIENGTYKPLSRPLFIYVNNESLQRPEVKEFVEFHISDQGQDLVALKGYIKLNADQLVTSRAAIPSSVGR